MAQGHLHSKTKKELQVLARQVGIPEWRSMTKKELLTHLWGKVNHDAFAPDPRCRGDQTLEKQKVEEAKYYLRKAPEPSPPEPRELPSGYGDDRIVLMVRDPYWVFVYWEITPARLREAQVSAGLGRQEASMALRLYRVTGQGDDGARIHSIVDIEITGGAHNWYINVPHPDCSYCVEIGLAGGEGCFVPLARSNVVTTPRAGMSDVLDESWMSQRAEYEKMYALSGGMELGDSSLELQEKLEKLLQQEMASGAAGSWGMWSGFLGRRARRFRFQLNTELVVYGSTEPDAEVTLEGKPIQLRADGTFSFRLALPDGQRSIQVTARSADGVEERTIIPEVEKRTQMPEPTMQKAPQRHS